MKSAEKFVDELFEQSSLWGRRIPRSDGKAWLLGDAVRSVIQAAQRDALEEAANAIRHEAITIPAEVDKFAALNTAKLVLIEAILARRPE